jgi:hypothetical protein
MISDLKQTLVEHFSDCEKTVTQISANVTDNKQFYTSAGKLYCLDSIVEKHFKTQPKSADAICITDKTVVLIEFKEGKKTNIKPNEIKLKLFDSLNVLYQVIKSKTATAVTRTDFWAMEFAYIVIYRDDEKLASIKSRLERAQVKWSLEEYSDLYIKSAITEFSPESVKIILNKITDNACLDLDYVS